MTSRAPQSRQVVNREQTFDGVRIEYTARGLRITRPWQKVAGYGMLFWVVVWFGMVSFFTSLGGNQNDGLTLLLAIPGVAMVYTALTRFFNKTIIDITPAHIEVYHEPLPWPGRRRFMVCDVKALHVKVKKIHAKGATIDESWILIENNKGKKSMLVKGIEMSALQMSGIAATVSDYLGVPVYAEK